MLFTSLAFRWLDETAARQVDSDARFASTRLMGMMDDNLDGKLQKAEAKGQMGTMIANFFDRIDANKDGSLDKVELAAAQALMPNRRRGADTAEAPKPTTGGGR
jgi:hypothetical protein